MTTPTANPSAKSVLGALAQVNGYVNVAVQLGEVLIPLGKALISKIESIGQGNATITYQLLVAGDQTELQDVNQLSTDDLNAINAELTRLGKAPLTLPAPTPPSTT